MSNLIKSPVFPVLDWNYYFLFSVLISLLIVLTLLSIYQLSTHVKKDRFTVDNCDCGL